MHLPFLWVTDQLAIYFERSYTVKIRLIVLGLRGVLCAIICPLILTLDPCRGPIGD